MWVEVGWFKRRMVVSVPGLTLHSGIFRSESLGENFSGLCPGAVGEIVVIFGSSEEPLR